MNQTIIIDQLPHIWVIVKFVRETPKGLYEDTYDTGIERRLSKTEIKDRVPLQDGQERILISKSYADINRLYE